MNLKKHPKHLEHTILVEGGGDGTADRECKYAFAKLIEKLFDKETKFRPTFIPCGGREQAYKRFKTYHSKKREGEYIAMLIDSEITIDNEKCGSADSLVLNAWTHLQEVPLRELGMSAMPQPTGAQDDQVLFMTTCMETWIVADRDAISAYFHPKPLHYINLSSLPSLTELETKDRHTIQKSLETATKDCSNAYKHGEKATRAYKCVGELNPDTLEQHLPNFKRVRSILKQKLVATP